MLVDWLYIYIYVGKNSINLLSITLWWEIHACFSVVQIFHWNLLVLYEALSLHRDSNFLSSRL